MHIANSDMTYQLGQPYTHMGREWVITAVINRVDGIWLRLERDKGDCKVVQEVRA